MGELIRGNNKEIEVIRTRIVKFEAGRLIEKYPVLLLDVSGSMQQSVGNRRKIDILRDAVERVGIGMDIYCFSDRMTKTKYIPEPQSSTNLIGAFLELKGQSMQLLLISDGIADDPEDAIAAGILLGCPVNVLYIGSVGDQGESFMRKLAESTGGKWLTLDTMQEAGVFQQKLENGIERLLLVGGYERIQKSIIYQ